MYSPAKTYRIETPRLVIRCYEPNDAVLLKKSVDESLEHLKPWMPWARNEPEPLPAKIERLRTFRGHFDLGMDYTFGVFNKNETELLGSAGLHTRLEDSAREIGYWVNINHLKKGIATEIVNALAKTGFEIEMLNRIEIRCDVNNKISALVPQKLGFVLKETLIGGVKDVYGKERNTMIWEMSRENYLLSPIGKLEIKAFDVTGQPLITSDIAG